MASSAAAVARPAAVVVVSVEPEIARPCPRLGLLGVPVDRCDRDLVRGWIERQLATVHPGGCRHLVTLNPEYVSGARADADFAQAIAAADLITADGIGVRLAALLLHGAAARGLRRVTGIEICDLIAAACARHGRSLYLLGGRNGVAAETAARLRARHPRLMIAGCWEGGTPDPGDDAATLTRIGSSGAAALLVAYGAPGQVYWIDRNRAALGERGVRLAAGVGGAFDVLSGRLPTAPTPVRRLGLEWLFRLLRQPWRWRRQMALPRFAALVVWAALRRDPRATAYPSPGEHCTRHSVVATPTADDR